MNFRQTILIGMMFPAILLAAGACSSVSQTGMPQVKEAADMAHNSMNSLDWAGSYKGKMPCADCEGIDTIITLKKDGTYVSQTRYLGKGDDKVYTETGKFSWSADGSTILADGMRLKMAENQIIWLDGDGKIITGDLANMFILTKLPQATLRETYWKLVEIGGQKPTPSRAEPYMTLKSDKSVNGFLGCNHMAGAYEAKESGGIKFGGLASTKMFCSNGMDTEQKFADTLSKADNYTIEGDTLTLTQSGTILAKFEAVYLH